MPLSPITEVRVLLTLVGEVCWIRARSQVLETLRIGQLRINFSSFALDELLCRFSKFNIAVLDRFSMWLHGLCFTLLLADSGRCVRPTHKTCLLLSGFILGRLHTRAFVSCSSDHILLHHWEHVACGWGTTPCYPDCVSSKLTHSRHPQWLSQLML